MSRFYASIHSIVGETIMIQPRYGSAIVERSSLTDFESILPAGEQNLFIFHVKESRRPMYSSWLQPAPASKAAPAPAAAAKAPTPTPDIPYTDAPVQQDWEKILAKTTDELNAESR